MTRRGKIALVAASPPVAVIVILALFWNWDWFIPFVDNSASVRIGHKVTMKQLRVRLGRVTTIRADQIVIANPPNFPAHAPLATIAHLTVSINLIDYIFHGRTVIPTINLDHPVIEAVAAPDKSTNYAIVPAKPSAKTVLSPELGTLSIEGGKLHFVDPALKADVHLAVKTEPATGAIAKTDQPQQLAASATGTYNNQPITGTLTAGALLTIRNTTKPYPIDLTLANGATHIALVGSVQNPLHFAGAHLRLTLAGADLSNLYALTGIPIPATPQYRITGNLAYHPGDIDFTGFHGTVGNSDLEGSIHENPGAAIINGKSRPVVHMILASHHVDLNDLGGFIGTKPGGTSEPGISPTQRAAIARSKAQHANFLPDKPFNLPKLEAADIYVKYHAASVVGQAMPFNRLTANLSIVKGAISLHPISFGIGTGKITGTINLTPESNQQIHAVAHIDLDNVNISTLLAATHLYKGSGLLQGKASLNATGNSIATWVGNGNGGLTLYMTGGNLSALLVSLSGLEFGNAVIAALGLPKQTDIHCFVGDFALTNGLLATNAILLDTGTAIVRGTGTINLKSEMLNYQIVSKPKHFSIGSMPAPIEITGALKKPDIGPAKGPLVARGGAVLALGIIGGPLALLPTIQFGTKDPHACQSLIATAEADAHKSTSGKPTPVPTTSPTRPSAAQLNEQQLKRSHNTKP